MRLLLTRAVLALAALLLAGCGPVGTSASEGERVPATPEALAAVALEHLAVEASSFELLWKPANGVVGVDLRYAAEPGEDGYLLRLSANPGVAPPCHRLHTCEPLETDRGTAEVRWSIGEPDIDPGMVRVVVQAEGEWYEAYSSGEFIEGDPREADLAVPVADLAAIVTDPRFGLTTTRDMAETRLDGFPRPDVSEPAPLTPRALAVRAIEQARVLDPAPTPEAAYAFVPEEYAGGDDVGVRVEFEGDVTLTVLLDRRPRPGATECPDGWTCVDPRRFVEVETSEKRMAGYTDGAVRAVEVRSGYAGVAQWDDPAVLTDDPAHVEFVLNQIVHALATEMAPRTAASRVRDGEKLDIWRD